MLIFTVSLVLALVVCPSLGQYSRNVVRSGDSGSVNLVEINIRGVIYGKCSFSDKDNEIEVMYEDRDGELVAKSVNPTVMDPLSKATMCRNAAAITPTSDSLQSRQTGASGNKAQSTEKIEERLSDIQNKLVSNQEYISNLRPRFVGSQMFGSLGIGLGSNSGLSNPFKFLPGISMNGNNDNNNNFSFGLSKPFSFFGRRRR